MPPNYGKEFEKTIKESFEKTNDTSVIRLHDQTTGYKGSANVCDFIVYRKPYQYFIECKSIHGNTFPLSNISMTQLYGLLKMSKIDGVYAGFIIWFIDKDVTLFVPADFVESIRREGRKSIRFDEEQTEFITRAKKVIPIFELIGRKKRIFFNYDMERFFAEFYKEDKK